MGLPLAVAEFLFFENSYSPIVGDVGFIGRQTTLLTEKALETLRLRYGVSTPSSFSLQYDSETNAFHDYGDHKLITDRCLVSLFGGKYLSIDVSDYEGADVIVDMSFPIPSEHYERFDFIFDGSCLDNIFNPAQAIMNMSKMLRPGGRLVSINHGTHINGPYTVFSPGWFFDFFVANKYRDCKVYLCIFRDSQSLHTGALPTLCYNWKISPMGRMPDLPAGNHVLLVVIAEKGADSTDDCQPVQSIYRDKEYFRTTFIQNFEAIAKSPRPMFGHNPYAQNDQDAFVTCRALGENIQL
jgi:SAM-dependent methyltransferase